MFYLIHKGEKGEIADAKKDIPKVSGHRYLSQRIRSQFDW